jgi:hypothetical protein
MEAVNGHDDEGPLSTGRLVADVASGAANALRSDLAPAADELAREARAGARQLGTLLVAAGLGWSALMLLSISATDALARRLGRPRAGLVVCGVLAAGAAATAAWAARLRPPAVGRRVLERLGAALRAPVRPSAP